MDSAGSLEELVSAMSARRHPADGHWGGALDVTWMPEVDRGHWEVSGSRGLGWGEGGGAGEGRGERCVWRMEREKAMCMSFDLNFSLSGAGVIPPV